MNAPAPAWTSFPEAKEAIETMPLAHLQQALGLPAPALLPFSGWSLGLGLILVLVGLRTPPILALGLAFALYGALALSVNRNRAALYRQSCYRTWVHQHAQALEDDELEDG